MSLLFVTVVVFIAGDLSPGDAASIRAGPKASAETVERLREQMGLKRPWPVRYWEWIRGVVSLDFGTSYYANRSVTRIIAESLPNTLKLAGMAIVLAAGLGLLMGTVAAVWRNTWPDGAMLSVSTLGVTVPNFVLAPILVYIFALHWDVLPSSWEVAESRVAPEIFYLILPTIVLAARPMALLTRLTRASMVETLHQEFIKLAIAKGVPPWRLNIRHALRNAILPVITAIGTSFGYLLTGSFIVETIFTIRGIGFETIWAIQQRDTPTVMAMTALIGALFIFANLIVDLFQQAIDPRIREAQV